MSVVVPVFNPGPAFDELIESLDRQSLAPSRFEVVLCDDGSDTQTRERLDAVARDRPNVRVLNLKHSGWPGMPRNHGIDAARGTYVQFVDQDDRLFPQALEKLCDYADRHSSDVVVGKEVGVGRRLPSRIFSRDIPHATLGEDPLLEMLTPHKFFRTSFLREHGIRFPEGRVRLEDHRFVMQAYFAAETISILASEPCYAWVKRSGSLSSSRIDPERYFPDLEGVLDIVEAHTEPGPLRDRLLRHWLRGKILKRVTGRRLLRYPPEYRDRLLDAVVPLVQRRFSPTVDRGLSLPHRISAALLRADRRADLLKFAEFEAGLECRAVLSGSRWSRGGGLYLTVRAELTRDGGPIGIDPTDAASLASSLAALLGLPAHTLQVAPGRRDDHVDLFLIDESGVERHLGGGRLGDDASVTVAVDPLRLFGRADPSRGGRIVAKVRRAGWSFDVPLEAATLALAGSSPLLAGRVCVLASADQGVELRREWPAGRVRDAAGRTVRLTRRLVRRVARLRGVSH